ncbi:MAG: glycosyltransferase family protein, partial [Nitrososphaera sp.]|uniref:glycosyltransferase family protein n=1 Tax=Nitrososphaera sp. TaxID=1971748 RepID=UPI003D6E7C37
LSGLEKQGMIETVHVLRQTFDNALKMIASSDIVVGKILPDIGWFGKFELEAMALGKPVIAYVSDELYEKHRPPVYRTTKESFQEDLARLVSDEKAQRALAQAGRAYAEENHDVRKVAARLEKYYEMI